MLRGSYKKYAKYQRNTKPTLQNQITSLKYKVGSLKPETQYFRGVGNHTSTSGSTEITNLLPTGNLIASSGFRDNVTGDRWVNKFLKLRFVAEPANTLLRVIVYFPKKPGTRFTPSSFATVSIPDPSTMWVLMDKTVTEKDASGKFSFDALINLKGKHTIYDSNSATIERGELIVAVMSAGTATSLQYSYGYELGYCNK